MSDFLLELRCEEIPARMQAGARGELEKLFRREMEAAGVSVGDLSVWSTPRRLTLIARDLPEATEAVSEEAKGPPVGAPDQAVEGFCRKLGITRDALEMRDVKGRETYFAVIDTPGRPMRDVLAEAIPAVIRDFSWPKSMRWGAASLSTESLRWVRPLSGIVALLGDAVVDCEVHGIASGRETFGHRFHSTGAITLANADEYASKLRAAHVTVDHEERAAIIREGAAKVAADAGLTLVEDEGLVIENAGLTEWPAPLLGRFDEDFLDVPPEVIQLTARVNQKYFVCTAPLPPAGGAGGGPVTHPAASDSPSLNPSRKREGDLANAFICTANIDAVDPAVVVDGNRKVLAARLSDARFFWEQDKKVPLAEHAKKLSRITFHEKLGTVADKVERVAKLARWLVEEGIVKESPLPTGEGPGVGGATPDTSNPHPQPLPQGEGASLADLAYEAAKLCKADLVTEMVGEFPELQGLMGGYYARAEGLDPQVADAIRDHYKPVGQGDDVPTAPVTVAVSLADKLDTLLSFFAVDELPTGSKDPFALRRAALGIARTIIFNAIPFNLGGLQSRWDCEFDPDKRGWIKTQAGLGISETILGKPNPHDLEALFYGLSPAEFMEVLSDTNWREEVVSNERRTLDFFAERLKVQQREAGVRHDLIDAVFALGGEDDLVRLLARVHALQAFVETGDGVNLLAGYKRAANILKKENHPLVTPAQAGAQLDSGLRRNDDMMSTGDEDPLENVDDPEMRAIYAEQIAQSGSGLSYTPEAAEKALINALDAAEPLAAEAIAKEDFAAAMSALASLRAPIDAFFEEVTVNDADQAKRKSRLALLARFRAAVHNVADFSKIEG